MRVRDWMSPDPATVTTSATTGETRELMAYYGVRHVPVVQGDQLVGIVTTTDCLLAALSSPATAGPPAARCMSARRVVRHNR